MFPTFISILDIQSWWEVPSIAHFCSLFRSAFNLLDFDIEDLEEALLTDGTEETSWLQELIVRLLSGCIPNNEISTFNYQMFLRRLFRQKCQEHDRYNPFNTDIDFTLLPLRTKVDILYSLCDFRLDADDVLDKLKNLEADSLRVEPLGYDSNESAYWYFYGTRLYREDFKTKNNKKKSIWQVICFSEEDWFHLTKKFKKSTNKAERQLYQTLCENFLPELPRLFKEKEKLARKRLLDNQPRRTSTRLKKSDFPDKKEGESEKDVELEDGKKKEEEKDKDVDSKRKLAYERRNKLKEQAEVSSDESSAEEDVRPEKRFKKSKTKNTKTTNVKKDKKKSESVKTEIAKPLGRQTNNSLSAVTGTIVIDSFSTQSKKKEKKPTIYLQTYEDLQIGMHKILDYLKDHEDAWPFTEPVEEEIAPNYYSVIRKPMDLQTMEERLDSGHYKTFSKFRNDFQLIINNCRLYNGLENEYTEMANNLLKEFKLAAERYLDLSTSSEDEFMFEPNMDLNEKESKDKKIPEVTNLKKRKPTLAAMTDKKKEESLSEESDESLSDYDKSFDDKDESHSKIKKTEKKNKNKLKHEKVEKIEKSVKDNKKDKLSNKLKSSKKESVKEVSRDSKKEKKELKEEPPPKVKKENKIPPKKQENTQSSSLVVSKLENKQIEGLLVKKSHHKKHGSDNSFGYHENSSKNTEKENNFEFSSTIHKNKQEHVSHSKPKDKHNKLRETIEKLKAKNDISLKEDDVFNMDLEKIKNEKNSSEQSTNKQKINKTSKYDLFGDDIFAMDFKSDNVNKSKTKESQAAKNSELEALTLATEQTLKDINKWLDDAPPRITEYSSASNSPSYASLEDFDLKADSDPKKKTDKSIPKKDALNKESKKRPAPRDAKIFKKRDIQRTIDRLQPGKSKGNLISNAQKNEEPFSLNPIIKNKDLKNSLIVKTDSNAPKLSLGSVLDSFGKHKFIDDQKEEEKIVEENTASSDAATGLSNLIKGKPEDKIEEVVKEEKKEDAPEPLKESFGGATPNLSAWFKAFGAPKVQSTPKKNESKDAEKSDTENSKSEPKNDSSNKVPSSHPSPNCESPLPGHPVPRQRKISTGSSVSERSSFSQDMDSPRVGIDERLGAYPAPYPSPLHRSPSGASPVMASPQPDASPRATYPTINGQIRVGFYQDIVSNKSSPDKSCSPREGTNSPYPQYPEHLYSANALKSPPYSYVSPQYSNVNSTPPYRMDTCSSQMYYDTNKSLVNQYQERTNQVPEPDLSPCSESQSPNPNCPKLQINQDFEKQQTQEFQRQQQITQELERQKQEIERQQQITQELERQQQELNKKQQEEQQKAQEQQKLAELEKEQERQRFEEMEKQEQMRLEELERQKRIEMERQQHVPRMQQQFERQQMQPRSVAEKSNMQTSIFPMKKRLYSDSDQATLNRKQGSKGDNFQNDTASHQYKMEENQIEAHKAYPTQNNLQSNTIQTEKVQNQNITSQAAPSMAHMSNPRNMSYRNENFNNDFAYPLTIPRGIHHADIERKLDISKYTNMGYTEPDVQNFSRSLQQTYGLQQQENQFIQAAVSGSNQSSQQITSCSQPNEIRYPVPNNVLSNLGYKDIDLKHNQQLQNNFSAHQNEHQNQQSILDNRFMQSGDLSSYKVPDIQVPDRTSAFDMNQPLRNNLPNLVDRYDDRMASQFFADKTLNNPHMFNKHIVTSSSALPMFNSPSISFSQAMQSSNIQGRGHLGNMQSTAAPVNERVPQVQQPQAPATEKKSKKKKSSKAAASTSHQTDTQTTNQGFQSYSGLKNNMGASPISLKSSGVVPGSAFNFGPTAGLQSLYDKETYNTFLDEYRAPNYYHMTSATNRTQPSAENQQSSTTSGQPPGYQFLAAHQARPNYPLGRPFISPQSQLMDPNSPLYQHYLQTGVLNQGLLGHSAYPGGYHPALGIRQPFDSMTRPSWL